MQTTVAILIALAAVTGPRADEQQVNQADVVTVEGCLVSLIDEVQVASPVNGLLKSIDVKEGQPVNVDQVIVRLEDTDVQIARRVASGEEQVAIREAENDVNVRAADKAAEVAKAELAESHAANQQMEGVIPPQQVRRELLTWQRALLQGEVAEHELGVAGITAIVRHEQVVAADHDVDRRQIKAKINGIVEQRYKTASEWVTAGDPILRIVRMDQLRVEGLVSIHTHTPQDIQGQPVMVQVSLAGRTESFEGTLVFVSQEVEDGDHYHVFAEVNNRFEDGWVLRPGLDATMTIQLGVNDLASDTDAAETTGAAETTDTTEFEELDVLRVTVGEGKEVSDALESEQVAPFIAP